MILAAIINAWDSIELLKYAIASTASRVDLYVIVYQTESNFGEKYNPIPEIEAVCNLFLGKKFVFEYYEPIIHGGMNNEKNKRNIGIFKAQEYKCTHFMMQDCDEMYENFPACVQAYIDSGFEGSVCEIYTYFKLPTLRFENPDNYFVPFIHKLERNTKAGTPNYPFYVDPTRSVNCENVVKLPIFMHHFSYIRKDIGRKIRNSSAKANLQASTIWYDYTNAIPGYHVKPFFDQKLIEMPNQFNIEI